MEIKGEGREFKVKLDKETFDKVCGYGVKYGKKKTTRLRLKGQLKRIKKGFEERHKYNESPYPNHLESYQIYNMISLGLTLKKCPDKCNLTIEYYS